MTGQVSRTVYNYLDLVTHIPHFVDYFLNFAVYDFYSVLDAVCDPQDFRIRHPSLLLRQHVKNLDGVL